MKGVRTTNPIAVGDRVCFEIQNDETSESGQNGVIYEIETRKNYIIRKASNLSKESQIIAANVDQVFLVVTVNYPVTLPGFIDRYLISAEAYRVPAALVFNKLDLYNEKDYEKLDELLQTYESIGYPCYQISAEKNFNIDPLREAMKGKISLLSGHSGVGKSTLLNALQPGLNLKTSEISDAHQQGKHTTTFAEMFPLSFGGYIIDSPGIKEFGLIEFEKEEVSHYFPEMLRLLPACKFSNCTHTHEPQCAVKEALEKGEIAPSRYQNYISIIENEDIDLKDWMLK